MTAECWIDVGGLEDVPMRGARRVERLGGLPAIAVFRTGEDELFALVDRCPHLGGPLSEGIVQGRAVACPLHGWVIELDSGKAEAPDEGCTRSVPVKLIAGRIMLLLASPGILNGQAA